MAAGELAVAALGAMTALLTAGGTFGGLYLKKRSRELNERERLVDDVRKQRDEWKKEAERLEAENDRLGALNTGLEDDAGRFKSRRDEANRRVTFLEQELANKNKQIEGLMYLERRNKQRDDP